MIRQYLSNTNKSTTVIILSKNLELNKASLRELGGGGGRGGESEAR